MYAATIFDEISNSVDLLGFADDHILSNQFEANTRILEAESVLDLEDTLIDIKSWMDAVKLKMNPDITEYIMFGSRIQLSKCVTNSINVVEDLIESSECIRYLGGFLDSGMSFREHVKRKSRNAIVNFEKIRKIRSFLTEEAAEVLLLGLVMSHIDYGNCLLMGVPDITIKPYQRLQNMCAKLVLQKSKYDSATEALQRLHWLPIRARIEFKIVTITHQCVYGQAPDYLKCLLRKVSVNKQLRSAARKTYDLEVPFNKAKTFGDRSFMYFAPLTWNQLPIDIKGEQNLVTFKHKCKTYFYQKYFN